MKESSTNSLTSAYCANTLGDNCQGTKRRQPLGTRLDIWTGVQIAYQGRKQNVWSSRDSNTRLPASVITKKRRLTSGDFTVTTNSNKHNKHDHFTDCHRNWYKVSLTLHRLFLNTHVNHWLTGYRRCHSSGGCSSTSYRERPCSIPGHSIWNWSGKVILGQTLQRVLRLSLINMIPAFLLTHINSSAVRAMPLLWAQSAKLRDFLAWIKSI